MLKTKEQIVEQQKEKLALHIEAVQEDIEGLNNDVNDISARQKEIKDVAPEVYNILTGIQRDLRFGRDRLKSLSNTLFK